MDIFKIFKKYLFGSDTTNTRQVSNQKESSVLFPGLVHVDVDEILNLPDIQFPRSRLRPLPSSLKLPNSSLENESVCNRKIKSTHAVLLEIFTKISCKGQTEEAIFELYQFKLEHPEADIEPYMKTTSDFIQNCFRQGIQEMEKVKSPFEYSIDMSGKIDPLMWNAVLSKKFPTFGKSKLNPRAFPLPPCTKDTLPIDYVKWLKRFVAHLGMNASKYDDPAFLKRVIGSGSEGSILNDEEVARFLPDISSTKTTLARSGVPCSSLNLLDSVEKESALKLGVSQLTADYIPDAMEAFAQMEEVLKQENQSVIDSHYKVNQLLHFGIVQYLKMHIKHMANENVCETDVISLYKCVTSTLIALFDNPALAMKASRDVLKGLLSILVIVMLDDSLKNDALLTLINALIMRILQKSNPTNVLSELIKLLHNCFIVKNVFSKFTDIVMKYLWKMIRLLPQIICNLNIDSILLDIHMLLKAFPSWRTDKSSILIRTVKTLLFKFVQIKSHDIMKHLSLITNTHESGIEEYLDLLIRWKTTGCRPKSFSKEICNSKSNTMHGSLMKIFEKISCKGQTKEGITELYQFKLKHPEADIEPYLKNTSDFIQNYIRQGIQEMKKENLQSDIFGKMDPILWNAILSNKFPKFGKSKLNPNASQVFPPLPPCIKDTLPIDLVKWLKHFVAQLGMNTSKYDDADFLKKFTGSGSEGSILSEKEVARILAEIEC